MFLYLIILKFLWIIRFIFYFFYFLWWFLFFCYYSCNLIFLKEFVYIFVYVYIVFCDFSLVLLVKFKNVFCIYIFVVLSCSMVVCWWVLLIVYWFFCFNLFDGIFCLELSFYVWNSWSCFFLGFYDNIWCSYIVGIELVFCLLCFIIGYFSY